MYNTLSASIYDDCLWQSGKSGKTRYIINIIKHNQTLIEPPPDKLIYLYSVEQTGYDEIKKHVRDNADNSTLQTYEFLDCSQGIPPWEEIKPKLGKATLLVLDDLMIIGASNKSNLENLNNIASRDSHHSNTSVIFVSEFKLWFGKIAKLSCK